VTTNNTEMLSNLLSQYHSEENEQSLEMFFLSVKDFVFRFAYLINQSESNANTVVVNTFFQILKKTQKYPPPETSDEKVKSWLLSIALIFIRQFSKENNKGANESNTYKKVTHKDNLKQILMMQSLLQLQETLKVPLYLHHYENISYIEIGSIYHLSQQIIKKNITTGIEQLKISLKNSGISLTNDLIVREMEVVKLPEPKAELTNQIRIENLASLTLKELTSPSNNSSFQWLIVLILLVPVIFGGIYLFGEINEIMKHQTQKNQQQTKSPEKIAPQVNKKLWDFKNENADGFTVLKGNWVHNINFGFMKTDYNTTTLIQTPFQFHKDSAPLVFKINSIIFNPFVDRPISSRLCGYLINGDTTVPYQFTNHITQIDKKEKTPLLNGNYIDYNVYLIIHQKGIFLVDRKNQFINSMAFTNVLSDNNIVVISFDNIYLKRIEVETLTLLPLEWEAHIQATFAEQPPTNQIP